MKFAWELLTCSGSCSSRTRHPAVETKLLVVEEPRRRRPGQRQVMARGSDREWRPPLSPISEDVLLAERISNKVQRPAAAWPRKLKRKTSSMSRRDRSRPSDHDDDRRPGLSAMMLTFAPTPFMF